MEAGKEKRIKIFVEDGQRVIGREGLLVDDDDDADFLTIINENGLRESIAKRIVLRYVEVV